MKWHDPKTSWNDSKMSWNDPKMKAGACQIMALFTSHICELQELGFHDYRRAYMN